MVMIDEWTRSVLEVNKGKMTFRFDEHGSERNLSHNSDPIYQDRYTLKDETSNQNFENDRVSLENNKFKVVEHTADWGDPFTDYTETGGAIVPSYSTRSPRTSWWKIAGSVTGAVVTGLLFGLVVLSLFNQEVTFPIPGISKPNQVTNESSEAIPAMGQITEEILAPFDGLEETKIEIKLPEETYYFLQYGVFSAAGGVELAQKELQDSGIAAARDAIDEKRVYAGVSTDREQAKLLSSQLKTVGVNLILHEISLPPSVQVEFVGDPMTLERYLSQSAELVEQLSASSASHLIESEPTVQTVEEMNALRESHQRWTESATAVRGTLSTDLENDANEMEKAINSAVMAMGEYNKKGAKTLLWEVQNEMMRFIMAQQRMLHKTGEN